MVVAQRSERGAFASETTEASVEPTATGGMSDIDEWGYNSMNSN